MPDVNLYEIPPIKRVGNPRLYLTPDGAKYPSVNTVLQATKSEEDKKSLEDWKKNNAASSHISAEAMHVGTQTHEMIEAWLLGRADVPDAHLLARSHYQNLKEYFTTIRDVRGIELRMWSDRLRTAGTADCVGHWDGKLSIIDWKTKRSAPKHEWLTDYYLQGAAYADMVLERTGDKVEQVVICWSSAYDGKKGCSVERVEDHLPAFEERRRRYDEILKGAGA